MIDFSTTLGQVSCPSCSKPLTVDLTTRTNPVDRDMKANIKGFKSSSILNRIRLDNFQTSTKIDALVCDHEMFHSLLILPSDRNVIKKIINNEDFV